MNGHDNEQILDLEQVLAGVLIGALPLGEAVQTISLETSSPSASRAPERSLDILIAGVEAPLLGVVANGFCPGRLGSYSYSYGYSQYRSEPASGDSPNGAGGTAEAPVTSAATRSDE
jgi:hypothetical protein